MKLNFFAESLLSFHTTKQWLTTVCESFRWLASSLHRKSLDESTDRSADEAATCVLKRYYRKKKTKKNKKQNQKTLQSTVATTLVNAFSWRKAHWRVPCSQEFQPTEAAGQVKGSTQCKTLNSRQAPLAWVLCHALEKGYFKVVLIHSCQQLPNKI